MSVWVIKAYKESLWLFRSRSVNLKLNLCRGMGHSSFKRGCGKPIDSSRWHRWPGESRSHWGVNGCLRNPPLYLLITSIFSVPLKSLFKPVRHWMLYVQKTLALSWSNVLMSQSRKQRFWEVKSVGPKARQRHRQNMNLYFLTDATAPSHPSPFSAFTLIFILTYLPPQLTHSQMH